MAAEQNQLVAQAGPSRIPMQMLATEEVNSTSSNIVENVEHKQSFTAGDDFIAFAAGSDDDEPKKLLRDWDIGKRDRDRDDGRRGERDINDRKSGRKRSWEDAEMDDTSSRRDTGHRNTDFGVKKTPWTTNVNWKHCRNVPQLYESTYFLNFFAILTLS